MKVKITTTIHTPEIPGSIDMEKGTLGDLLALLFAGTHFAGEVIDPETGEVNIEGLFEVNLNGIGRNRLPEGLNTPLKDGDAVQMSLVLIGGG
jgi:hypothetical protein